MTLVLKVDENISLKHIELADAPAIFNTINSQREYLGKWLPFVKITRKVEDTEKFIRSVINTPQDQFEYTFIIQYKNNFAGVTGFRGTDRQNKRTEIGYWLSEPLQNNGIVTKSVQKLCEFAFNELKVHRIQIRCAVDNHASKGIPRRLGFKTEGIERDGELLTNGQFTDLEVFSKLKNES